jgi:hypothetical protein
MYSTMKHCEHAPQSHTWLSKPLGFSMRQRRPVRRRRISLLQSGFAQNIAIVSSGAVVERCRRLRPARTRRRGRGFVNNCLCFATRHDARTAQKRLLDPHAGHSRLRRGFATVMAFCPSTRNRLPVPNFRKNAAQTGFAYLAGIALPRVNRYAERLLLFCERPPQRYFPACIFWRLVPAHACVDRIAHQRRQSVPNSFSDGVRSVLFGKNDIQCNVPTGPVPYDSHLFTPGKYPVL